MNASGFIASLRSSDDYRDQILHVEEIARKSAVYGDVEPAICGQIGDALAGLGINRLYAHQADAVEAVRRGEHVVVVTGTASGKTLCYNVPVLEAIELDRKARALYIYPTKALAQDQLGKLREYGLDFLKAATYDGDTPRQERPFIKTSANVVLTNPDMLHMGILPYHTTWSDFFRNLKYVVIDEVHTYRGVFGAHVANIMRRLRRLANYYGSDPQFVCASATVTNPAKLVKDLIGVDARVIDNDGSPSGKKHFIFWNPPFLAEKNERRSTNVETVELFTAMIGNGIRTIVFTKARKTAELILRHARSSLRDSKSINADRIMAYRAGYRPAERRDIERRLFNGELLGVTSTTALEVGVDIGGLDGVIMTGYPGTIAATWQQAGRAGRGTEESMAVLVAYENPMDQFLMRNPGYFFSAKHENAIVDSQNPYILSDHLLCAAYEMPIAESEVSAVFGERAWEILGELGELDVLNFRNGYFRCGVDYPAKGVNIRSTSKDTYLIVSVEKGGTLLGTADGGMAFETIHAGAVYLHAGESYVVTKFDVEQKVAYVEKSEVNYYTTPGSHIRINIDHDTESKPMGVGTAHFGDVVVGCQVTHYWKKQLFTEQMLDRVSLDLPESELNTEAAWIVLPMELTDRAMGRGIDLQGAIHAIEHAAIGIMPLFALCDRNDIGGVSHPMHPDTDSNAAIFIYDGHPGGVGLSRAAYDSLDELLDATLKAIEDCPCDDGCPSCVQSPKCGNNNEPLDKDGAVYILRELLGR
ncbi:MAG: DEAD/DEAH box helicase [Armatimonadetes bacterium]|nr:DEAD/DEAH box helicase [Armatimonadota bacterium]